MQLCQKICPTLLPRDGEICILSYVDIMQRGEQLWLSDTKNERQAF